MNKTIKGLAFAAMLALSLVASTSGALAKDKAGRETAWTDLGPLPIPQGVTWETAPLDPVGVTWEQ
jgi:ABC-type nitrate/sulfonate/bicarbonate transport system substrate-binding protein